MSDIDSIKLEIVRPGRRHGQLLSKLTHYVVLCEGTDSDTVSVPFDHYELRADIRALRYYIAGAEGQQAVPSPTRADAVRRLSERLESVIEQMRSLQSRISEARCNADLTHVRLILGGSELSLIPFELATAPSGWRGAGNKIALQTRSPVVFTREIRESERIPLNWNQSPRVLVISASPKGFPPPPLLAHVTGILRALRPQIETGEDGDNGIRPSDLVTVLENASLESIEWEMSKNIYTHVHFICHGCAFPGDDDRFGLALSAHSAPHMLKPVNGEMLADVLLGPPNNRRSPTMVVMACCDSANQNTVETPGASIADHLHREGIPWVLASQLPLTYGGSEVLANVWYQGIFSGEDPRSVLYQLRQVLSRNTENHDWASVVAYGAFPDNFDAQVRDFRIRRMRRLIESAFHRAAAIQGNNPDDPSIRAEFEKIDDYMQRWQSSLYPRKTRNSSEWGEYLGMAGAIAKQKAELVRGKEAADLLQQAADCYLDAAKAQIGNHWVIVQYLVLSALLGHENPDFKGWFETALRSALLDKGDPQSRIWALGSLIELAILSDNNSAGGKSAEEWAQIFTAEADPTGFELFSTRRQLERYAKYWAPLFQDRVGALKPRVYAALACLQNV